MINVIWAKVWTDALLCPARFAAVLLTILLFILSAILLFVGIIAAYRMIGWVWNFHSKDFKWKFLVSKKEGPSFEIGPADKIEEMIEGLQERINVLEELVNGKGETEHD